MREMRIEAIYKKPRLSIPHPGHQKYPYLMKDLEIIQINMREEEWLAQGE
jgi:putative transposase